MTADVSGSTLEGRQLSRNTLFRIIQYPTILRLSLIILLFWASLYGTRISLMIRLIDGMSKLEQMS